MNKLKYLGYDVVFQEVPDEISLAFNISGCPHKCEGCHSQYLWEYKGQYLSDDFESILNKYAKLITCVCFMGGDQNSEELTQMCNIAHKNGLKTALYTGCDSIDEIQQNLLNSLDYIKIGHYDKSCGGLDNKNTNQRMLKRVAVLKWEDTYAYRWYDITREFQKE